MRNNFISLTLATIMVVVLLIFSFLKRKELDSIEESNILGNKFQSIILSPFFYLSFEKDHLVLKLSSNKLKVTLKNLFGDKVLKAKILIHFSKKIALIFYTFFFTFILFSITSNLILLGAGILISVLFYFYLDSLVYDTYKQTVKNLKSDLPNFVTRLSLLIESGIGLRNSIEYIVERSSGSIVDRFLFLQSLIANGLSEQDAYNQLLITTDDIMIRKFISLILQNLKKGGDDISKSLQIIKKESDEYRKTQMIIDTQESNRKLLYPNTLIFLGIMIMVMVPVFINLL